MNSDGVLPIDLGTDFFQENPALLTQSIPPETTIAAAQQLLQPKDTALAVASGGRQLGIISRRDLALAAHYGLSHALVRDHMTANSESQPGSQEQVEGLLNRLRQRLQPALWQLLTIAAQQAQTQDWQLYLVGGAVRDLLRSVLSREELLSSDDLEQGLLLQDIDLVVDGGARSTNAGAGVKLARSLQAAYPQARLEIHSKFQTAAVIWSNDPNLQSLGVDIATARTEFYAYPAANPQVQPGSIRQDLYRRDFTINALAIRLTEPRSGELLDFFGGWRDLQSQEIRVLHANSFIEDPTRIFRAVRFATRLGFRLEAQTEKFIRYAIASGLYNEIHDRFQQGLIAPALQTRLKAELKYLLQSPYWQAGLVKLAELQALQCIHPQLTADRSLWRQLRWLERWLLHQPDKTPWLLRLEVILARLEPLERGFTAENLQLPRESCDRLQALASAEVEIAQVLSTCQRPSQVVQLLDRYPEPLLVLVGVRGGSALRGLWRYLLHWRATPAWLNGQDLKALGYRPGVQFKQILAALKVATLDGEVGDRGSAIEFVQRKFS
ncbi:MAG TPA: hypothetical protein V6D18_00050 [Thermosynechococcaceae cyanobacterium]